MSVRSSRLGWVVVTASLALVAACGGESSDAASTERASSRPGPGTAEIVAFDVPETVACEGRTSTTVSVTYATEGAAKVIFKVDGRPIPEASLPDATLEVPVRCDPFPHDFVLVLEDDAGGQTDDERFLTTEL